MVTPMATNGFLPELQNWNNVPTGMVRQSRSR
jgi:hypothetical protein